MSEDHRTVVPETIRLKLENAEWKGEVNARIGQISAMTMAIEKSSEKVEASVNNLAQQFLLHETRCAADKARAEEKRTETKTEIDIVKKTVDEHKGTLIKLSVIAGGIQLIVVSLLIPVIVAASSSIMTSKLEALLKATENQKVKKDG